MMGRLSKDISAALVCDNSTCEIFRIQEKIRNTAGPNIDVSFGPKGALLGALWWSTLRSSSDSYELHLMLHYIVNVRNQAESTEQSRFPCPPPLVEFCSVNSPHMSHFRASHYATYCVRRSLTSYMHTCSPTLLRARCRRHIMCETPRAQQQVPQHFDGTLANGSPFTQPVDLISFTSHGAD